MSANRKRKPRKLAVLDLETDPFDAEKGTPVYPFLAVLYSAEFGAIVIWNEDWKELVNEIVRTIAFLPDRYTVYAHNGGRFDYMFLVHALRGTVQFKGRAIMRAKIGEHELRDSLHIIPEALKNANDKAIVDYRWFRAGERGKHVPEIIRYCVSDCEFTFETVSAFVERFGQPLTIGQAAMKELKRHYTFKRLGRHADEYLRDYFFGGRVECIAPAGVYPGRYKLFDVHSMYPSVMAQQHHPIGDEFFVNDRVTKRTAFIHCRCRNNSALVSIDDQGLLTAGISRGEFRTTIHEFHMARELDLIGDIEIIKTIDFYEWTDFSNFILPLYNERQRLKEEVKPLAPSPARKRMEQDIKFYKYLLNNSYGKFAQNPRRFREYWITDPGAKPPEWWLYAGIFDDQENAGDLKRMRLLPEIEHSAYWIWSHEAPEWRFNNVATAASITGAARAKLLQAICAADDPLYCDTDSLVCRDLPGLDITPSELGTWNLEHELSEFVVAGKKLYAFKTVAGKTVIRCKGNKSFDPDHPELGGITYADMIDLAGGRALKRKLPAPTLGRDGQQRYIEREIRRTARPAPGPMLSYGTL